MQIIIQQEIQKLTEILLKSLILKHKIEIKFQEKLETFTKSKKRNLSTLVFLVMKIRKNIQFMYQKNAVKKSMLI